MKLIFYHFLHLYFLTLFEVIFYIYYVMPYEKELVYNLFNSNDIPIYNKTFVDIYHDLYYSEEKCKNYQDKLDSSNLKLFDNCIIYLIIINILLILLFIKDIYQNYTIFCDKSISPKNHGQSQNCNLTFNSNSSLIAFKSSQNIINDYKKNDDSTIELAELTNENKNAHVHVYELSNKLKLSLISEEIFIVYYYKNSEVVKEIGKLIQFIILVGIFEYVFFTTIINKYKIANIHTIICKIIKDLI